MISFCNGGSSQLTHWEESRANSMPYCFRDSTGNLLTYYVFTSNTRILFKEATPTLKCCDHFVVLPQACYIYTAEMLLVLLLSMFSAVSSQDCPPGE